MPRSQAASPIDGALIRRLAKQKNLPALRSALDATEDSAERTRLVCEGNVNGKTALHFASQWCGAATVALLLEHGANVDAATVRGQEPLAFAIGRRRYDNIELLLDAGASVLTRTVQGETPLGMAKRFLPDERPDLLERIRALASVGRAAASANAVRDFTSDPRAIAAQIAHARASAWRDYTSDPRAIAAQIVHARTCDHCRRLADPPPSTATMPPVATLSPAASFARTSAATLAAKVRRAASGTDVDALRALLDEGADLESPTAMAGRTALMLAAWRGDISCLRLLLERGAAIDRYTMGTGNYGKTPIFYAITRCRDAIVVELVDAGASVLIVNNKGQTPLSLAASHCTSATIEAIKGAERCQLGDALRRGKDGHAAWQNFRRSNSDGKEYGDLDPRFLESPDDDVKGAFWTRSHVVNAASSSSSSSSSSPPPPGAVGDGASGAVVIGAPPLSVRPTTAAERQRRAPRLLKTADGGLLPWVSQWRHDVAQAAAEGRVFGAATVAEDAVARTTLATLPPASWSVASEAPRLGVAIVTHMVKLTSKEDYEARCAAFTAALNCAADAAGAEGAAEVSELAVASKSTDAEESTAAVAMLSSAERTGVMLLSLLRATSVVAVRASLRRSTLCATKRVACKQAKVLRKMVLDGVVQRELLLASKSPWLACIPWSVLTADEEEVALDWLAELLAAGTGGGSGAVAFENVSVQGAPLLIVGAARTLAAANAASRAAAAHTAAARRARGGVSAEDARMATEKRKVGTKMTGSERAGRDEAALALEQRVVAALAAAVPYSQYRAALLPSPCLPQPAVAAGGADAHSTRSTVTKFLAMRSDVPVHVVTTAPDCAAARARLEAATLVAIDTEWGADVTAGCALVQLAVFPGNYVCLVDMVACAKSGARSDACALLRWLFADRTAAAAGHVCLGWSFGSDCVQLEKLEAGLGVLAGAATCDLQRTVMQQRALGESGGGVGGGSRNGRPVGLAAVAARVLGAALDKTEQCSSWGVRPLRATQVKYAALDAAVLVDLAAELRLSGEGGRG